MLKPTRVLVMDDDKVCCATGRRTVTSVVPGAEVLTERNPLMFLQVVEEFKPDLIIIDIMLKTISGLDLLRKIRRGGNMTYAIICTGLDPEGLKDIVMRKVPQNHILGVIAKPLYPDKLSDVLNRGKEITTDTREVQAI